MRTHTHTQWWDCDYVREWESEPIVRLNPEDAVEYVSWLITPYIFSMATATSLKAWLAHTWLYSRDGRLA